MYTYKRHVPRRRFRLANRTHADVDLTQYEDIIIDVIKSIAPDSNPIVTKEYYEINEISHRQLIAIGHELAKANRLGHLCKIIEQVRLFEGHEVMEDTDRSVPDVKDGTEAAVKETKKGGHQ